MFSYNIYILDLITTKNSAWNIFFERDTTSDANHFPTKTQIFVFKICIERHITSKILFKSNAANVISQWGILAKSN